MVWGIFLHFKLAACCMESLFVDEKVGVGGEADVEERKERAQLCVAMGSIPRDVEEAKCVGR